MMVLSLVADAALIANTTKDNRFYTPDPDYVPDLPVAAGTLDWVDAKVFVRGTGFAPNTKSAFYDRLPAGAVNTTRQAVWSLSRDTDGVCVVCMCVSMCSQHVY